MNTSTILIALALACAACGGAPTYTETCEASLASHDFGTTDPAVLGRVTALASSPNGFLAPNDPAGAAIETEVPVRFEGSVGYASCAAGVTSVTFIEP